MLFHIIFFENTPFLFEALLSKIKLFNYIINEVCQRLQPAQGRTDRPGLFYEVFNNHLVLNGPKRYDILKFLIKH